MELVKRDNSVYLVFSSEDYLLPRIIKSYWKVNVDSDLIPDNPYIEMFGKCYIINNGYRNITFSVSNFADFTEFVAIKPPRKKGYIWKHGRWAKK
jgi:hypothetical protein